MHKVSIVVPVYNVSKYLGKCVESLLYQTYTNIEIILVDDGSTDECPSICDVFSKRDSRIKVIHKVNGGLSSARNEGIEFATGEYIAFVDSDDYVTPDYVESLLNSCINNNCKISACGYYEFYSSDNCKVICGDSASLISCDEAIKDIFTMKNEVCVVAWNKLYATSLFKDNNIRYPDGKIHEDVFTTYKLCASADTVAYVNRPMYYYVQHQTSIMGQGFSPKRLQLLEAVESIKPFVEENSPSFDDEYDYYVFLNRLTLLNKMADSGYKDKKLFAELRKKVFESKNTLSNNKYFSKKHKFTCLFLRFGMNAFYLIRRLYNNAK